MTTAIYRLAYGFLLVCFLSLVAVSGTCQESPDPLASRVLVVFSRNDGGSREVAKYYAKMRGIPPQNLCSIAPIDFVGLAWNEYIAQVRNPVKKCLIAVGPKNILYIVFTYNTPFRVRSPDKQHEAQFALDQFVADIWDQYVSYGTGFGRLQPYYVDARSKENIYPPFESFADFRAQPTNKVIYSVWRLDGPTAAIAKHLVDKAMEAEKSGLTGVACFDRRWPIKGQEDKGYGAGDWDLHRAAGFARQAGFKVIEDDNDAEFGTPPAPMCPDAALYSGWYSLNHYNNAFTWVPGAIGFHLDSLSAWSPRTGQSWVFNALEKGITVTSGAVEEPILAGLLRPGGTFRDLFQGANVGDAFLRNTRFLRWMILYIGDPLYRPFPDGLPPFNGKPAPQKPAPQTPATPQQSRPDDGHL
jgi:uncharacterized protein (TIGR03790 family)